MNCVFYLEAVLGEKGLRKMKELFPNGNFNKILCVLRVLCSEIIKYFLPQRTRRTQRCYSETVPWSEKRWLKLSLILLFLITA